MLELRPNCEWCDKDLPPEAADARICSYECTFCAACVEHHLQNVCPELWWRLRATADPARDRVARRGEPGASPAVRSAPVAEVVG